MGLDGVLRDPTIALGVYETKRMLSVSHPLLRCPPVPLRRFPIVLRHALAQVVQAAQTKLGLAIILVCQRQELAVGRS
jgi:hypothetical protein